MPYSWGDDTDQWKNPGVYDYGSARRAYVDPSGKKIDRDYVKRDAPDMKLVNPLNKQLHSTSQHPIIVGIDCTGSMSSWPAEIFDRLPLFCQTLAKYQPDVEIAFSVIGDATCDAYPLQVAHFGKGVELDTILKAFYPEGGGGGQTFESYELWAYFMNTHVSIPEAVSPFLLVLGDEDFYDTINAKQVKHYIGDTIQDGMKSGDVWQELTRKFNLFHLHKPYDQGTNDKKILKSWANALGEQRIIRIPSMERCVDIAMGIVARTWGHYEDFLVNMSARQDANTISKVKDALGGGADPGPGLKSKTLHKSTGDVSKPLI